MAFPPWEGACYAVRQCKSLAEQGTQRTSPLIFPSLLCIQSFYLVLKRQSVPAHSWGGTVRNTTNQRSWRSSLRTKHTKALKRKVLSLDAIKGERSITEKWEGILGATREQLMVLENTLNFETCWSKLSLSSNLRFSESQLTSIHCLVAGACVNKMRSLLSQDALSSWIYIIYFWSTLGHPSPKNHVYEVLEKTVLISLVSRILPWQYLCLQAVALLFQILRRVWHFLPVESNCTIIWTVQVTAKKTKTKTKTKSNPKTNDNKNNKKPQQK